MPRVLALLVLLALAACSEPPLAKHVVLVTLDTTRADAVGRPGVTPHLDALAADGVAFVNARTTAPITLPSHASMLTGLFPPRHGVRDNARQRLPRSAETLAERCRDAGIRTGAFLGSVVLDASYGLDQGFERYDAPPRGQVGVSGHYGERDAEDVVARATAWLDGLGADERVFLWVHLFDPHAAYAPPPRFLEQAGGDPYLGEVARADAAVGTLVADLRASGRLDEALVLVVGDHGEGLGEHGEDTHSAFVWDSTIRVPFVLRPPGGRAEARTLDAAVSVADVLPTALEALGLGGAGDVDGLSLVGALERGDADGPPADRAVYFESQYGHLHFGWSGAAGFADARTKYVHSSEPELFDVAADRDERTNLIDARAADARRFRDLLAELSSARALPPDEGSAGTLDAASLRALGYAGEGGVDDAVPPPHLPGDGPAPHARVDEWAAIVGAWNLVDAGRLDDAIERMRGVVEANPENPSAWNRLGEFLLRAERPAEAVDALRRVVALGRAWPDAWATLGRALARAGEPEEAARWLEQALAVDERDAGLCAELARVLATLGREDEARSYRAQAARLAALARAGAPR